jgi:bifunctional polynucleotide phosphatase/kinase
MEWNKDTEDLYLEGTADEFTLSNKLALFDLDGTLITTKSKSKFPKNKNDWKLLFNKKYILDKLDNLVKNNYSIIIISNQNGIKTGKQNKEDWKEKIENIYKEIKLPFKIYAAINNDKYRKPSPILFHEIIKNNKIDKNSFYCGDAAGRPEDFSDTDLKFALNIKLTFYTPEEFFLDKKKEESKISYINFEEIKKREIHEYKQEYKKEVIIMTGGPASGKSYIAKKLVNYVRINMDELGTKTKCIKKYKESIKNNKNIIIDNTNPDKKTRKEYIDIAKENNYKVISIIMDCSMKEAYHNMMYRHIYHDNKVIPKLVYNVYYKKYEEPCLEENIDKIIRLNISNRLLEDDNYKLFFY